MRHRKLCGGGCPSKAVIGIVTSLLLGIVGTPITANATTTTSTTSAYQLYDTRERNEQINVNKVWDDGLTNEDRFQYENNLSMTIKTSTPQTALRTYAITYDANGGNYGTDNNGKPITTNTITYNAKNQPTNGTYATPERNDGYAFLGWNISKAATTADSNITLTNTLTDKWMNKRTDGSTTTLYAVWKELHIHYAVMAYGIGVDKDANGKTMGITFGPALGYPEFSPYGASYNPPKPTFTKSHSVSGDTAVMSENAPACTDASHSVITGTDAGTDAAGNAYRCLHYDNWATIIYWNEHDPHVYDKCIPNHCSKTVRIAPNARTIANGIFDADRMWDSNRGLVGNGQSYIVMSKWDNSYVDITQAGQGYAVSLIRAELVGADSHTRLDDEYAGVDALTKYTTGSSILSCFPSVLRDAIGSKALSGVSAASSGDGMEYDVVSNDGVADKLWLFSYGEMTSAVYPAIGFKNDSTKDDKRTSMVGCVLRSPHYRDRMHKVSCFGDLDSSSGYASSYAIEVAPGFTLPSTEQEMHVMHGN